MNKTKIITVQRKMDCQSTGKPLGAVSKGEQKRCGCGQGCIIPGHVSNNYFSRYLEKGDKQVESVAESLLLSTHEKKTKETFLTEQKAVNYSEYDPYDQINHRLITNLVLERKSLMDKIKQLELQLKKCKCNKVGLSTVTQQ